MQLTTVGWVVPFSVRELGWHPTIRTQHQTMKYVQLAEQGCDAVVALGSVGGTHAELLATHGKCGARRQSVHKACNLVLSTDMRIGSWLAAHK